MPGERVLICGAGVAGSVLAFWLAKNGFEVVVVERSKAEQKAGQGIEIEEPALQVVKAMGIFDKLNAAKTGEIGFDLVNEKSHRLARFDIGTGPTGELELMRGDLTEILYKAADEYSNVTYRFETTIQSIRPTDDVVIVETINRNEKSSKTEEFHFVIGADGVKSRTRELVFGSPEKLNCFKRLGAYVAYLSIPKTDSDWPYSKACHFPGRHVMWIRPISEASPVSSVYLIHLNNDIPSLSHANATHDRMKQKETWAELLKGLSWEAPRVAEQMMKAENFYSDELMQVKLQKWSQGRVALVGDAAWAPTPFTGQGNQLAIIGGCVLAQEMSKNRSSAAFDAYEKRLRSYVEECQAIPFGGRAPSMCCPDTPFGIWCFRTFIIIFSKVLRLYNWLNLDKIASPKPQNYFDLQLNDEKTQKI